VSLSFGRHLARILQEGSCPAAPLCSVP